jgi:quinol-cytochrome oxidoreductase complex cytochrome b subunit
MGHPDNYIPANPMVTPAHIVPEWYFLPFYAILRSIPDKLGGVVAMGGALVILFFLPFINQSEIRSSAFRPIYRKGFWLFFVNFIILGWIGQNVVETPFIEIGMASTAFYFFFLLIFLPASGLAEKLLMNTNTSKLN